MTASAATYPGSASRSSRDTLCDRPFVGPGHQAGRARVRGHDDVAEGGAQAITGRLGHGFLPGPGDQEGAGPARRRDRGQRRLFGRGQHEARERLRIAVTAQRVRAPVKLLHVHADRGPRDRDRDQVAGVRDGMLDGAALDAPPSMTGLPCGSPHWPQVRSKRTSAGRRPVYRASAVFASAHPARKRARSSSRR